jgi:hypothetical protein
MQMAKPAAAIETNGGHQKKFAVTAWKPYEKGSLKGFFSATTPSGLIFHSLMLHERDGSRWISFPAKEYVDLQGQKQYARFVEFSDRASADRFRAAAIAALDEYLAGGAK